MSEVPVPKAHFPAKLKHGRRAEKIRKVVCEGIADGLDVREAFLAAGIGKQTYYKWRQWFVEDLANGYTGTQLIDLFLAVIEADVGLHRDLRKVMVEKAKAGDTRMLMYLEDNRFGAANKRKNNISLDSAKNAVQINIIGMSNVETDKVEEIEVHGECRDDSDTAEMDQ